MAVRPAALAGLLLLLPLAALGEPDSACGLSEDADGSDDAVGLLQTTRNRRDDDLRSFISELVRAAGADVDSGLLTKAVSETLVAKGNASVGSASYSGHVPLSSEIQAKILERLNGKKLAAVAEAIESAVEDSGLPSEVKEPTLKELRGRSLPVLSSMKTAVNQETGIPDLSSIMDQLSGMVPNGFQDIFKSSISQHATDIMEKLKGAASGSISDALKEKFGFDIDSLPFKIPGLSGANCATDTGGTCSSPFFGCDASRNAQCSSGKCLCGSGTCAERGTCVAQSSSSADSASWTGGTCRFSGCSASRDATCEGGKCVCTGGKKPQNGKCV